LALDWTFEAPQMQTLHVGSYSHASSSSTPSVPAISIGNCPGEATFDVLELNYDSSTGDVTQAAVEFHAPCGSASRPPTLGKFRFNSMHP
jgi:hypothetical protein